MRNVNDTRGRLPPIHPGGTVLNEEFLLPMKVTQYRLANEAIVRSTHVRDSKLSFTGSRSITAETAQWLVLALLSETPPRSGWWIAEPVFEALEVTRGTAPGFNRLRRGGGTTVLGP